MREQMRKLSIAKKLGLFFAVIGGLFLGLVVYIHVAISNLNNLHSYERDFVATRIEYLLEGHQAFTELRRILRISFYNDTFVAERDMVMWFRYQVALTDAYNTLISILEDYMEVVYEDGMVSEYEQYLRTEKMEVIKENIHRIYYIFYDNFFLGGNNSLNNHQASSHTDIIDDNFHQLRLMELSLREETRQSIDYQRITIEGVITSLAIGIMGIFIALATFTVINFSQVIARQKQAMEGILKGDFDKIIQNESMGELSLITVEIADNLQQIRGSIKKATREIFDYTELEPLDESAYNGIYKGIVKSINAMLETIRAERKDNEFQRIVFNAMPLISTIWTRDLRVLDSNDQVLNVYGYRTKQDYIEHFHRISPKYQENGRVSDDWALELVAEAFEKGFIQFEWMHQDLLGNKIPSDVILFKSYYRDQEVVVGFARDIRNLKKSMEQEKKHLAHIEFILANSPMVIDYWNKDFNNVYTNEAKTGIHTFEYIPYYQGKSELRLPALQPDGRESISIWQEIIEGTFKGTNSPNQKWECLYLSGKEEVYLEIEACKGMYQDREVVITYSKDITELRHAIQTTYRERERVAAEQENSKAKSMFLAKVSHEIRTPLSAVLGVSELQLMKADNPIETEEAFVKIHASATILLDIVNDILDLSKIESGNMPIQDQVYEVSSLIGDTAHMNLVYMGSKDIDFKVVVDPHLSEKLIGDELRIKQVINNVLSNSFKYTEQGHVLFKILQEGRGQQVTLKIIIEDTGIGMTEEQLDKLFDDFVRFEENTYLAEGTGLGMPIVKNFVELMGGKILVQSKKDVGTTVIIDIPQQISGTQFLGRETAQNLEDFKLNTMRAVEKLSFEPEQMLDAKVLVVDDIEANLYVTQGLLERYGIEVTTCTSGKKAIERVKEGERWDMILMDQMMPRMDGGQTTRVIRDLGYIGPIIAFTANALVGKAEEYIESGFDGFISKPIQMARLDNVLHKFLGHKIIHGQTEGFEYLEDPEMKAMIESDFRGTQADAYERLRTALRDKDLVAGQVIAHSVKTFGHLLGNKGLTDISKAIESLLGQGVTPNDEMLKGFRREIRRMLD